MSRHYCTYFDHRYLPRGLAMIRSLRRFETNAVVWVLCLSSTAYDILSRIAEPGVRAIALRDFEAGDAPLAEAKRDGRSQIEYYFTCTPSLVRYVLLEVPEADFVTYLDSDLWFFSSPEPIYREAAGASIVIVPHRFSPERRHLELYGIFNVGWLSFRRTPEAMACVEWWRDRCLEWCHDQLDDEHQRFADQRYLDRFSDLFPGTHVLAHKGANLAPWNVGNDELSVADGKVTIDDAPLIFFHFHGLKPLSDRIFLTALEAYGVLLNKIIREQIYIPYLLALRSIERELQPFMPEIPKALRQLAGSADDTRMDRLKIRLRTLRALATNCYIRLPRGYKRSMEQ